MRRRTFLAAPAAMAVGCKMSASKGPYRAEVRWGGVATFSFGAGGGGIVPGTQNLVSVNEMPTRTWAIMTSLQLEAGSTLVVGSSVDAEFLIAVGVGSGVVRIRRLLTLSLALLNPVAVENVVILPASSILVERVTVFLTDGAGQPHPVNIKFGVQCAPQFPFIQTLEKAEESWQ